MLKFTKDLEGSVISIIGIGNTSRVQKGAIKHATVVKVNPKSVIIKIEGHNLETKMNRYDNNESYGNHLTDGHNGGYVCYYSDSDILKEMNLATKLEKISNIINTYGKNNPEKIIQTIKDVLSEDGE